MGKNSIHPLRAMHIGELFLFWALIFYLMENFICPVHPFFIYEHFDLGKQLQLRNPLISTILNSNNRFAESFALAGYAAAQRSLEAERRPPRQEKSPAGTDDLHVSSVLEIQQLLSTTLKVTKVLLPY